MNVIEMLRSEYGERALWLAAAVLTGVVAGIVSVAVQFSLAFVLAAIVLLGFTIGFSGVLSRFGEFAPVEKVVLYLCVIAGFLGSAFFSVDIGPFSLFPFRILLAVLWLLLIAGIAAKKAGGAAGAIEVKTYLWFLAFWVLYSMVSVAWAADTEAAIRHSTFVLMGASVVFFVVLYFSNARDLKRLFMLWIAVLIAFIGIGLWNYVTGQQLPASRYAGMATDPFRSHLPTAVFYNTNDFATYIGLSAGFVLALFRYGKRMALRALAFAALLACIFLVVFTYSRANYLALAAGMIFWFLLLLDRRSRVRALVAVALVAVILLSAFPQWTTSTFEVIADEMGSLQAEVPGSAIVETDTTIRFNLIRNCLVFLTNSGGFGVGAGNAQHHMAMAASYPTRGILDPHNWWFEIMANYGILVFLGYVIAYLSLVARLYSIHRRLTDSSEKMVCEGLLIGLVAFFFASMSSSSIMALAPQWMLLAFAFAFLNWWRTRQEREVP